ncbi:MAG: hypothetical protein Q8P92_00755 [Candidatus Daviesbacteria bacterium]|nr:hypothetical protein [Candidatus Daviesbacteria bacterium]
MGIEISRTRGSLFESLAKKGARFLITKTPNLVFATAAVFSGSVPKDAKAVDDLDLIFPTPIVEQLNLNRYNSLELPILNPDGTRKQIRQLEQNYNSEAVYSTRQAWTTRLWWPIFESKALSDGLPRIADDWWPAHVYDITTGGIHNVQGQAWEKARNIMEQHPESESFAGYCPWVAIVQATEEQPVAFPGENLAGETDPERIIQLKEGLLVIKHAGDILVPVPTTTETFAAIIQNGFTMIVDMPVGKVGQWFRSVNGIEGNQLIVTNFGYPDIKLPIDGVVSAYIVYPADSTENFAPGIKDTTSFWRYNIDRAHINELVYGQ